MSMNRVVTIRPEFRIRICRCADCRRFCGGQGDWARCPHCGERFRSNLHKTISKLERSNAALRGALKRGRRK